MENLFKKEDTQIVKGTAIILMVTYHLFAYNNKVNSNIQFVFLSRNAIGYTIAYFGKDCELTNKLNRKILYLLI